MGGVGNEFLADGFEAAEFGDVGDDDDGTGASGGIDGGFHGDFHCGFDGERGGTDGDGARGVAAKFHFRTDAVFLFEAFIDQVLNSRVADEFPKWTTD